MHRPVIVGYDGSEHGRDALVLGRALARLLSAPLIALLAYTPEAWLWAPGTAEPADADEREQMTATARAALSTAPGAEVRVIASPSAAGALHAEAQKENAQLIVVGSCHHGTVGRILLGAVSQQVLDASPCAVAVAPAGLAGRPESRFDTIGVGYDDTPEAVNALQTATALARLRRPHSELRILWAAHLAARALPAAAVSYFNPHYFEQVRHQVADRLEEVAAPIRGDLQVRTQIASGRTTNAITDRSAHLDLLVVGSRGYGPVKRVLLGSVSRRLVRDARCPVLVVPRAIAPFSEQAQTATAAEPVAK